MLGLDVKTSLIPKMEQIGRRLRAKLLFPVKMALMAGELTLPASAWKLPAVKRRILPAVTIP